MPETKQRRYVLPCGVFGGRSPKTGKPVGSRHRWSGDKWGEGVCDFCGRLLEGVLEQEPPAKQRRRKTHVEKQK